MKSLRTALTTSLTACALLASWAVTAQTAAPASAPAASASGMAAQPHPHRHGAMDPARMQQRHEQRLTALRQALQLTPAQEPAWTQFAAAMRPPTAMAQRPDHDAMTRMTTPERIDLMQAMRQRHHAEMDRRAEATKAFYAALTPEQKKRFDDHTARSMGSMHGHGHGHGHGQGPGTPAPAADHKH